MTLIDSATVHSWLAKMASQLEINLADSVQDCIMIGIKTGGVTVAQALHQKLKLTETLGELNISFYRDDFSRIGLHPQVGSSSLPFEVENRTVILVDDVIYSGRTIRAAMNEIFDYGRPARIILAALVEREGRELPIRADIIGKSMDLLGSQQVKLQADDMSLIVLNEDEAQP